MNDQISSVLLPAPERPFPLEKGAYEVAPGLRALGRGEAVLRFDSQFKKYRANKIAARAERLGKYFACASFSQAAESAACRLLIDRMIEDAPATFSLSRGALDCALTGERLELDGRLQLMRASRAGVSAAADGEPAPPYGCAFDALCSQIQEDVAIVQADDARDWIAALHLCSPNHWSAEEKIGRSFVETHAPIPGIERINRAARSYVDAMIDKGPFVRFAWGFATDDRLNHHPEPPAGRETKEWRGRAFDAVAAEARGEAPFWLRVERQTLWGLPEARAAAFFIRTYFVDGREIIANARERALLRSALLSMTPESRVYKGVAKDFEAIIECLEP